MTIKKGDTVKVLAGKDRGKQAKVLRVFPQKSKVIVEGVNEVKRRTRPKKSNEKGQTLKVAAPVHISNVAIFCSTCGKGVRVGTRMEGVKKMRVCVKCKGTI